MAAKDSHRGASNDSQSRLRPKSDRALRTNAENLIHLFESNLIGIIVADSDGNITNANNYFLSALGYRRDDLPLLRDAVTPDQGQNRDHTRTFRGITYTAGAPFEMEYLGKDGRCVH